MRIGVISDSHNNWKNIAMALDRMGKIDVLIHAGDGYEDLNELNNLGNTNIIWVKGNCDLGEKQDEEKIVQLEGKKFLIVHGHQYSVKESLTRLYFRAKETEADLVIYGHSHIPEVFVQDGITFINPGSVSIPRTHKGKSFCIIDEKFGAEIIYYETNKKT